MSSGPARVWLSDLDEKRFGVRSARASGVTLESLPAVIEFCRENEVVFLIARCPTTGLQAVQAMERQGFLLMDTLMTYTKDLRKCPIPADEGDVPIRPLRPGEEEAVELVAREALRGYFGHYHADPRLDPAKCDEVYVDWAVRSCRSREVADEVLVAEWEGQVVGFGTMRRNSDEETEGVLYGVSPEHQRRGIYQSLALQGMEWALAQGAVRAVASTQVVNIGVQKVWSRLGLEPSHSHHTLHKWFDES
jgi:GNAT superfamily N-acetyltransferase